MLNSMGSVVSGRSTLLFLGLFCICSHIVVAQRSGRVDPLRGTNFIQASVSGNLTLALTDPGLFPALNSSFSLSAPGGAGFGVGLSYARLMPDLFVSTATTAELRLFYTRLIETASGSGVVQSNGRTGQGEVLVRQATTATATIVGVEPRFSFETRPMAKATPTILLGATLGHVTDMQFNTEYSPENVVPGSGDGLPEGGAVPDRRWFYAALHIGSGGRISLGDAADSPAIIPEVEVIIPLTSLARYSNWLPFGIRAGLGVRWPMKSS